MIRISASALILLVCLPGWINPSGRYAYAQYDDCYLTCSASAPATGTVGSMIAFSASVQATYCTGVPSYAWNFGDNQTSTQQSPTHVYQAPGTYSWSVTATIGGVSETQGGVIIISRSVTSVSAASYDGSGLAAESIAAAFGTGLAAQTELASTIPLPTEMGGTRVLIKDAGGVEHTAPLFFVSDGQINYYLPAEVAAGEATVSVMRGNDRAAIGSVMVSSIAPGLFTADSSGRGVAAALVLRLTEEGEQRLEPVARFDEDLGRFVAVPIDLGPEIDQVFLILFGTGLRYRSALSAVGASIADIDAQVLYAGAQDGFVGLDQVNLRLPRSLVGRGEVNLTLTVDGKTSNNVTINIK